MFITPDWHALFTFEQPLLETFIRGTVIYLFLFLLLRFVSVRQAGTLGISDLLVIILLADAAQNGMAGDYRTIPDGMLLISTLVFWNIALEWLTYHSRFMEKWLTPSPLPLVKDGLLIRRNMRRELITREELESQLREQGIRDIGEVALACLEGDGHISILSRKDASKQRSKAPPKKKAR